MSKSQNDYKDFRNSQVVTSPLWHFRHEHCKRCPFKDNCANDKDLELRCILSRIALDLHTLTRKTLLAAAHLYGVNRMTTEQNPCQHFCHLCGAPTETYVRDAVSPKKVPLCEECFKRIYPSKKNMQRIEFWRIIFPIIEQE